MKYVIHSKSEEGFWNAEQGWVFDIESATQFWDKEVASVHLPLSRGQDCEWICIYYRQ